MDCETEVQTNFLHLFWRFFSVGHFATLFQGLRGLRILVILLRNRRDRRWLVPGEHAPGGPHMATKQDDRIVETPTEARQAEPGPSIFLVLNASVALAAIALSIVWFIFFRT